MFLLIPYDVRTDEYSEAFQKFNTDRRVKRAKRSGAISHVGAQCMLSHKHIRSPHGPTPELMELQKTAIKDLAVDNYKKVICKRDGTFIRQLAFQRKEMKG